MTRFAFLQFAMIAVVVVAFSPSSYTISSRRGRSSSAALHAQREATFGMGCFWKPAEELLKVPGVIDTVAGYTGNPQSTSAPTYDSVCFGRGWVEGVRVIYDDEQISYQQLLDKFFESQEPKIGSRQYASLIFPHDKEQEEISKEWLQKNKDRRRSRDGIPGSITAVEPLSSFYQAEQYHQRYWEKQRLRFGLIALFTAVSSGILDRFVSSPELQSTIHTGGNALALASCMFILLERKLDSSVVKL